MNINVSISIHFQAKAWALHQLSLWASEHRSVGRLGRYAQQLAAEAAETPRLAKRRRTKALEAVEVWGDGKNGGCGEKNYTWAIFNR